MTLNNIKIEIDEFVDSNKNFLKHIDFIIGVSRGGLIPAVLISTKLNKPLVTAYINKEDRIFFDRTDWIDKKRVLIVDDIIRSGKTMFLLKKHLRKNAKAKDIFIYTIYSVKKLRNEKYNITVLSKEIEENIDLPWDY